MFDRSMPYMRGATWGVKFFGDFKEAEKFDFVWRYTIFSYLDVKRFLVHVPSTVLYIYGLFIQKRLKVCCLPPIYWV